MRAHYFQHVPFEGLGSIEPWLIKAGHEITKSLFFNSTTLPEPTGIDLLIIMGGPMGVHDEEQFPWLVAEKKFIRDFIESGKPVLGICLGAQLIADAMGAKVYPGPEKEIGWFSIQGTGSDERQSFQFPPSLEVFHWHGDTFELPEGATRLARSRGCENQAFQLGRSVIGLQFHLETTPESAAAIVSNCREELVSAPYIQTEKEILAVDSECYSEINKVMDNILTYLVRPKR
jgi:GMP synthase-like glutamine amidotransferase